MERISGDKSLATSDGLRSHAADSPSLTHCLQGFTLEVAPAQTLAYPMCFAGKTEALNSGLLNLTCGALFALKTEPKVWKQNATQSAAAGLTTTHFSPGS